MDSSHSKWEIFKPPFEMNSIDVYVCRTVAGLDRVLVDLATSVHANTQSTYCPVVHHPMNNQLIVFLAFAPMKILSIT